MCHAISDSSNDFRENLSLRTMIELFIKKFMVPLEVCRDSCSKVSDHFQIEMKYNSLVFLIFSRFQK